MDKVDGVVDGFQIVDGGLAGHDHAALGPGVHPPTLAYSTSTDISTKEGVPAA